MGQLSITMFKKILRASGVTHLAFPRCDPESAFIYYKITPFTKKRTIWNDHYKRSKKVVNISTKIQKQVYDILIEKNSFSESYIVGISSEPTDMLALEFTGMIHYALLKNNPDVRCSWLNAGEYDYQKSTVEIARPNVIIIHNIFKDSTPQRIQYVRDLIVRNPRSLRIVVVGGINALTFFDDYLSHGVSGVINIGGRSNEMPNSLFSSDEETDPIPERAVFTPDYLEFLKELREKPGSVVRETKSKKKK